MAIADVSIVVPMFNEEAVLPLFIERLRPVADGLGTSYEVLAVDDGSSDGTAIGLQRARVAWPHLRVVRLRANAGHQAAISAGLALARGRYVVTLDADLQDPPEVLAQMLRVAQEQQVDVVYGVRSDRSSDSWFKRSTARVFYHSMDRLAETGAHHDAGDFRLMSRATVDAINALPEYGRVLRFVVPALGFPSASVDYQRAERAAGQSKYPFTKMLRLSIDSVTAFSLAPLRFATFLGLFGGFLALLLLLYALFARFSGQVVAGWTSTVVIVAAVGALQLLALGILGEYVGRLYAASQARPSYYVAYDSEATSDPAR